jgi:hypothetical protein
MPTRRAKAEESFNQHENRTDAMNVVNSLNDGLSILSDLLFTRVHADVELVIGVDSMLLPVAALQSEARARKEIEIYLIAESVAEARTNHYVSTDDDWYLHWLGQLRIGTQMDNPEVINRLADYGSKPPDDRRISFCGMLERTFREAAHAPLIIYRLLPLAIWIATAMAFGDHPRAALARRQQMNLLSAIGDCRQCHGSLLENGEKCAECGNPLWKFEWLTAE